MDEMCLCGSTFFNLLLSIRNSGKPSQEECFRGFISIVDPQAVSMFQGKNADLYSLKPYASNLKNCKNISGKNVYMHFGDSLVADEYESRLREDPQSVYDAIEEYFANNTKNTTYVKEWVVKQLLGLIEADSNIGKNIFIVRPGFIQTYREELLESKEIFFYPFIAGMLLYVYRYCDDNTVGEGTISKWKGMDTGADYMGVLEKYQELSIKHEKPVMTNPNAIGEALSSHLGGIHEVVQNINTEHIANALLAAFGGKQSKIDYYVKRVYEDYRECSTFRYRHKRPFYDFYVCNDLKPRIIKPFVFKTVNRDDEPAKEPEPIKDVTIDRFLNRQAMIIGSGGFGKTMMMRHLLLSCENASTEDKLVPIFVMLGKFKSNPSGGLMDLIYDEVTALSPEMELSDITAILSTGRVVLFLDGFDEIPQEHRDKFVESMTKLMRQYNQCTYILSTRNNWHIDRLDNFLKFDIMPLDTDQAVTMIQKLDWATDELKKNIIGDIRANRFRLNIEEKERFLGNPLFLTIIVTTYQYTHNIQTKRYLFYDDAYSVMYKEHDGIKGITRPYDTNLDEVEFKLLFGEFCALAFSQTEYKFDTETFRSYFGEVIEANGLSIPVEAFEKDITEKLCLMYLEGDVYHWVHRSFQEYLAAFFFAHQVDSRFAPILDTFIDLDEEIGDDETLSMLYGINKEKTELNIIIPYLERQVIGCYNYNEDHQAYMTAYRDFIEEFYGGVTFGTGGIDCGQAYSNHEVYNFIIDQYDLKCEPSDEDFPGLDIEESIFATKMYSVRTDRVSEKGYTIYDTIEENSLTDIQRAIVDGEMEDDGSDIEYAGAQIEIQFRDVYDTSLGLKYHQKAAEYIEADTFCLKREFDAVVNLVNELKKKYKTKKQGSFLSKFH